jgi:hydrogenase expression/formation protein HypD
VTVSTAIAPHLERLRAAAARLAPREITLMEVCGTHTMAIARQGLRALFPPNVRLISGPGCPVCVTPQGTIDRMVALARIPGVTIATFGDMLHVPGTESSLERERARGADVRVVYSPMEALARARQDASREVVFLAVGFETTAPTIAGTLLAARAEGVKNFTVAVAGKVVPPALEALLGFDDLALDGLLCPGHVSVIIGARAYEFIPLEHGIPCAIAGFEAGEILAGVASLADQLADGRAEVENLYPAWVKPEGNPRAQAAIAAVFETADAEWRGIGVIPGSGYCLRPEWSEFDAFARFAIPEMQAPEPAGCRCGEVLRGSARPRDCALFGAVCTPQNPIGPCMVSSEGSCAAEFKYAKR